MARSFLYPDDHVMKSLIVDKAVFCVFEVMSTAHEHVWHPQTRMRLPERVLYVAYHA